MAEIIYFPVNDPAQSEISDRLLEACQLYYELGVASLIGCLDRLISQDFEDIEGDEEDLILLCEGILEEYEASRSVFIGCLRIAQLVIFSDNFLVYEDE